jgi:tol-pal system protein YbgF
MQAEPRPQPTPAPLAAPAPVAPAPRSGATVGGQPEDPAAARGYVLGTLPRDAIVGDRSSLPPATSGRAQTAGTPAIAAPPRNAGPKLRYDAALAMLQAGDLANAQQEFTGFIQDYPDDPLAPNAAYWLGETHYVQKDYPTAAALFARNYQTYGADASKAPDNLLKLGKSLAALGDNDKACQTYAELEKRYPNAAAPIRQELARSRTASSCR